MTLPIQGSLALVLAVVFGAIFGALLQKGRVTDYNVIVNQFRFKDFTVLRVMLTAIIVGAIGIYFFHQAEMAQYHIKSADLLAVVLGSTLFGIGMVLYGYCPGTGIAALGTGSLHALAGIIGMLAGGVLYALSFAWIRDNILTVGSYGKVRLPDITGISDPWWIAALVLIGLGLFCVVDRRA